MVLKYTVMRILLYLYLSGPALLNAGLLFVTSTLTGYFYLSKCCEYFFHHWISVFVGWSCVVTGHTAVKPKNGYHIKDRTETLSVCGVPMLSSLRSTVLNELPYEPARRPGRAALARRPGPVFGSPRRGVILSFATLRCSRLPACRRGGAEEEPLAGTERVSCTVTFITNKNCLWAL